MRDDAAVVYLNGVEVWRDPNLPGAGAINYNTPADAALGGADESTWLSFAVDPALLHFGANVIAIEVHQNAVNSSDLAMSFELTAVLLLPLDVPLAIQGNTLSWPAAGGWFSVVAATNLTPSNPWTPLTNPSVFMDNKWRITLPVETNGQRYFRLRSQ